MTEEEYIQLTNLTLIRQIEPLVRNLMGSKKRLLGMSEQQRKEILTMLGDARRYLEINGVNITHE